MDHPDEPGDGEGALEFRQADRQKLIATDLVTAAMRDAYPCPQAGPSLPKF
jgi:hypothetical protein